MTFKEIDINNRDYTEGRSCVIVCNFSSKEIKLVENCANMAGVKNIIKVSGEVGESIVKDIIEYKELVKNPQKYRDKTIVFNNIPNNKMSLFMDILKRVKFSNVLYAIITEVSKEWTLNELISNLIQERIAMKSGQQMNHK